MSDKIRLLLVDDDTENSRFLQSTLNEIGYDTLVCVNGREALNLLQQPEHGVQAIISDVAMPVMNGYDLCMAVREDDNLSHIPFIFLSAYSSLEEKLKGFGVGGDEYIGKPLDIADAILKIQRVVDSKLHHLNLNQQLKDSSSIAFQAMTYTSHLGNILQFLQTALQAETYEKLAMLAFDVTTNLGLKCNLQFHTPKGMFDFSSQGTVLPLESNVMEMSHAKGRIFDFAQRTIFNYDDFSLLIKNMPKDDPAQYGQIKDLMGNFCNAVAAAVKLLNSSSKIQSKDEIINTVNSAITEVNKTFKAVQQDTSEAITHMSEELDEAMLTQLGLSESQEETIHAIVNEMRRRTAINFQQIDILQTNLENIRASLKNAAE